MDKKAAFYMHDLQLLIQADAMRMAALHAVAELGLPDCYIAAGFVRNLVWDHIHGYPSTSLNDVDVIYFNPDQSICAQSCERLLNERFDGFCWEVKNQAVIHLKNDDRPYTSSLDAMRFWPEKETAIGVRINPDVGLEVAAPFGLESLFNGHITHNPKRSEQIFKHRIDSKQWLKHWPELKVMGG